GPEASGLFTILLGAALSAAAAAGGILRLRKRADDPVPWMLGAAAAMHLLWGWHYERYWIPLLPLFLVCAARAFGRAAPAVLGLLLALQLLQVPRVLRGGPASAPELKDTYAWLREHHAEGDVLASALFVRDGWYAGMPSLPLAEAADSAALASLFRRWRIRYVLWENVDLGLSLDETSDLRSRLNGVGRLLEDRTRFTPVYSGRGMEAATVFEVAKP
ncbi:MAG: hypothetical protein HY925_03040, partial [Elusimicrobia bacterium]|nr:hypothetical protein [Elusimicrobiota bacterium]